MEAFAKRADVSQPGPSKKSCNWPCLIVLIVLAMILVCSGVCGGVFLAIAGAMKSSPVYRMALERVQSDPQVIEELGQPIAGTSWLPTGNIAVTNDSGRASLDFNVAGPSGSAHVRTEARMIGGQWGLTSVEVHLDGGETLSLDVGSDEGLSDAPAWSPQGGQTTTPGESDSPPPAINRRPALGRGHPIAEYPPGAGVRASADLQHPLQRFEGVGRRLVIHSDHVHRRAGSQILQRPAEMRRIDAVHGGAHADDRREEVDFLLGVLVLQTLDQV